jgi:hypothetical protein
VYGKNLIENTSEVAQGLLVKGLESATSSELKTIANGIHLVVNMLGAKETPPQLMFSSEINMPSK